MPFRPRMHCIRLPRCVVSDSTRDASACGALGFTPIAIASPSSEGVIMNVLRIGSRAIAAAVAIVGVSSSAIATDAGFDCGSGDGHGYGRKSLRIVGLTSEGALLCFNEHAPRASRTIGYVN